MARRIRLLPAFALALASCSSEPSFDERFDAAKEKTQKTSTEIGKALEASASAAADDVELVPEPMASLPAL